MNAWKAINSQRPELPCNQSDISCSLRSHNMIPIITQTMTVLKHRSKFWVAICRSVNLRRIYDLLVKRRLVIPRSWNTPFFTRKKDLKTAPSSKIDLECGGIEPGVMPPISAWCPRLATKNTGLTWPSVNTYMSQQWTPTCHSSEHLHVTAVNTYMSQL